MNRTKYYFIIFLLLIDIAILMSSNIIKEKTSNHNKINYDKEHKKTLELSIENEELDYQLKDAKDEIDQHTY